MDIIRPLAITDAILTAHNVVETDYAAWSAVTTYALGNRVIVTTPNVHKIYESKQNANTNHDPTLDTTSTWWLLVGATNRWKMFDASPTSQTTNADSITATFAVPQRIDSVAFINVSASSARVKVTVPGEGVVYDNTVSLVSDSGIADYWEYCFEPFVLISDYVFGDLPPYDASTVDITLTDTGATVKCGCCVPGLSRSLGGTKYGTRVGILDYSVKKKDDFGNATITVRDYARRGNFTVVVENSAIDALVNLLAQYRATPVVWVGSTLYGSTIQYGWYRDFEVTIARPKDSICTIETEGLT